MPENPPSDGGHQGQQARVDVVLPCLNEATALPIVLSALPPGMRAIVVDNGSDDGSGEVARALGALVVAEQRRGFGAACHAGLAAATAPVVAFCDADATLDLRDLVRVTGPVIAGTCDMVLGRRRATSTSAWPVHARVANHVLAAAVRRRTHLAVHDIAPMRAARREALLGLGLRDRRFGYPLEMVLRAAVAGWTVAEVDVSYLPRIGKSKVTGTLRGTALTALDMRRAMRELA